jgi:uridine phosphorylase
VLDATSARTPRLLSCSRAFWGAWDPLPDWAGMDNRCAYRETPAKIELRRLEGYVAVEMEADAVAAVAAFLGVPLAQVLYGG